MIPVRATDTQQPGPRRHGVSISCVAAVVFGAAVLGYGIDVYAPASADHAAAVKVLRAATQRTANVRQRANAATASRVNLRAQLRAQRGRLATLRHARAIGFVSAVALGAERGERAGEKDGNAHGIADGRAQRADLPGPGWYYVRVGWTNGLPVVTDSYVLDSGPTHAYSVENGQAWNRDTTTQ
jgi:hypothetical protein